ncbi:MAG: PEP-CTERM sorting domain-containing protein [Armatimonadetes bacterium]|nr:PEP-CTERM sorting domain-containing protein [Akkermansiaceae bacterium]
MKKLSPVTKFGVLALFLGMSSTSRAALITTTFNGSNGSGGITGGNWTFMFNLTVANTGGITFDAFTVNVAQSASHTLDVYVRPTTYLGFENTPAAWTLVSSGSSGPGSNANGPVFIDVANFSLAAGTYGFALVNTNYQAWITFGSNNYSNSDIAIETGAVISGPLSGGTASSTATWNGSIDYAVIPEPSSGFLIFSAVGFILVNRKRVKS